jgi:hypothetical protein
MSIFAKKTDGEQKTLVDLGTAPPAAPAAKPGPRYGIADAIQLLRGLPAEQNSELVIRVMRATLASLNVHLPDIIEDASRKQKATTERIASAHAQVAELERQLEGHKREIVALEADLKETTVVKERLQQAEKAASLASGPPRTPPPRPTPPQATPVAELKD